MILIATGNLKEGMVVAKPIVIQGKTLLSAGSQLSAKHLLTFKAWGVADAWIEGDQDSACAAPDLESEEYSPIKEKIHRRFSKCDNGSNVIAELKRLAFMRECTLHEQAKTLSGALR